MGQRRLAAALVIATALATGAFVIVLAQRVSRGPASFSRGGEPFGRAGIEEPLGPPRPPAPVPREEPGRAEEPAPPQPQPAPPSPRPAPPPDRPAAPGPAPGISSLAHPAPGEYRYALQGWEQTTLPGSRRDFPPTASMVVHSPRPGPSGMELTFDLTYIPGSHEERLVAAYGPEGVSAVFEAGRIVFFGLVPQTSEAVYVPPVLRTPFPASPGHSWSGASEARDPRSGAVTRRESFRGTVLPTEILSVAGRSVETIVVEWRSDFSGQERGARSKKLWFAPGLGLWVKWHERLHGERFNFSYDEEATLTLEQLPR